MQSLLEACGRVVRWKRTNDPTTNQLTTFGFCDFASASSALLCLKLLPNMGVLLSAGQPGPAQPISVILEAKCKDFLAAYEVEHRRLTHIARPPRASNAQSSLTATRHRVSLRWSIDDTRITW